MERVIRRFKTFEDAERADEEYYASLTPAERVDILLGLIEQYEHSRGTASQRFERVYRVTQLTRG